MKAPLPNNEISRLETLYAHRILDTLPEQAYDDITLLASQICDTPIALVSLIDEHRQWFKSRVGLSAEETHRDIAFCSHAIAASPPETLVIHDALQDRRFAQNPLVTSEPNIRFYAGVPLVTPDQHALGTLCVIDHTPRDLTPGQLASLNALARQVSAQLELRRVSQQLALANEKLRDLSLTDELTGLYNRRGFALYAEQQLRLARTRPTRHPLVVIFADIDGLKPINDRFGHQAGSDILIAAGKVLKKIFRDSDVLARWGGDEFAILAIDAGAASCEQIEKRIDDKVREFNTQSGLPYALSISAGAVSFEGNHSDELDALIDRADQRMYRHKKEKRTPHGNRA